MTRLACLAAVAVLGLAACGGGDDAGGGDRLTKAEYEAEVTELGNAVAGSFESLDASSPGDAAEQLDRAREGIDELAARLDDVSPPEEIEEAHDKLVTGLRQFSDDLDGIGERLAEAASSEDPAAALEILGEFAALESVRTLQEAQQEFEAKGYDLGLDEGS